MSHVRKMGNGRYEARYRAPNGREHARRFATKREALRFLERVGAEQQRGEWRDPAGARLRLADWVDQWWATTVNLKPSSRARDESYIRNHVLPAFGDLALGRITQLDVRAWVSELDSRRAPATVHKAYQTLSKIMRAAVDANLIAQSPCRSVPLPSIQREEMRFLTPAEIAGLAAVITPRYRALVVFDAYGGLRLGELSGLRRSRVDLLRREVRVAEIAVEVRGELISGSPKTRSGSRTVPIPRFVADALGNHLDQFCAPEADALVLPGQMVGRCERTAGVPGTGDRQSVQPESSRSAPTTSATRRWRYGSPPAPARSRSPPGPGTRRFRSSSTATAISFPATNRRCSTGGPRSGPSTAVW